MNDTTSESIDAAKSDETAASAKSRPWAAIAVYGGLVFLFAFYQIAPLVYTHFQEESVAESAESNMDVKGWVGQTFWGRTYMAVAEIHPNTPLGLKLQEAFPGPYRALAFAVNNAKGLRDVTVDLRDARVYDFTGRSIPCVPPQKIAAGEEARQWMQILPQPFTVRCHADGNANGDGGVSAEFARTCLLFLPDEVPPEKWYALEIHVTDSEKSSKYTIEGVPKTEDEKKEKLASQLASLFVTEKRAKEDPPPPFAEETPVVRLSGRSIIMDIMPSYVEQPDQ